MNVTELNLNQPDQDVIDACERLLKLAKDGELTGIAWGAVMTENRGAHGYSTTNGVDLFSLLGELHVACSMVSDECRGLQ